APGNDRGVVSKQHAPTITHEPPAASAIRARIDAAGRALALASFVRPMRVAHLRAKPCNNWQLDARPALQGQPPLDAARVHDAARALRDPGVAGGDPRAGC